MKKIKLILYRWAGEWGGFKVKIPCGECTITKDIIQDVLENELKGVDIEVEVKDWLSHWWEPILKGGYHAPIVMVEGKIVSQGEALNRGLLVQSLINEAVKYENIEGNVVFGKETCPYCLKAKALMKSHGIDYEYKNVIKDSAALYRMVPQVKKIIGEKTPVTLPQIWLEGKYIGGYEDLEKHLNK
jgi:glutaredoxin